MPRDLPGQLSFLDRLSAIPVRAQEPDPVTLETPPAAPCDPDAPLSEGCRIAWRDNAGRDWRGLYRFTLGNLASIELDDAPGVVARRVRVRPDTLRREGAVHAHAC